MLRHSVIGLIIVFVAVAMLGGQPATAQNTTPTQSSTVSPDCKPADLINTFGSIKSVGDPQKDIDILLKLDDAIKTQYAACNGMLFKGLGEKSVGPLTLDTGTYLVHLVTNGYFIGQLKVLSGTCGVANALPDMTIYLYDLFNGQASDGADVAVDSSGCRVIILTSNVSDPWTMTITKLA